MASQNKSRTGSKLAPNRIFDAEALKKPLESLLERSWSLLERSWTAPTALLEPKALQYRAQDPPNKPEQVVGPESTVLSICLHLAVW